MATTGNEESPIGLRTHSTSPDKTVFMEPENSDGWIATNYTVAIER